MLLDRPVREIVSGRKVVAVAGTPEALTAAALSISWVIVTAETDNTGLIAVGDTAIDAAAGTQQGTILAAGQSATIPIDDLSKVYIDASVAGDGVAFNYGQV